MGNGKDAIAHQALGRVGQLFCSCFVVQHGDTDMMLVLFLYCLLAVGQRDFNILNIDRFVVRCVFAVM